MIRLLKQLVCWHDFGRWVPVWSNFQQRQCKKCDKRQTRY